MGIWFAFGDEAERVSELCVSVHTDVLEYDTLLVLVFISLVSAYVLTMIVSWLITVSDYHWASSVLC